MGHCEGSPGPVDSPAPAESTFQESVVKVESYDDAGRHDGAGRHAVSIGVHGQRGQVVHGPAEPHAGVRA